MTLDLSDITDAAIDLDDTRPIHLIRMSWVTESRIATYDENISWNSETWSASGASVDGLGIGGGVLILPNGDDDPWLNLVRTERPLKRAIEVYEWHTDFSASPRVSDATLFFAGVMDECVITPQEIRISLIEGATNKVFPPSSIGSPNYNWLLPVGSRIFWGADIVTTN